MLGAACMPVKAWNGQVTWVPGSPVCLAERKAVPYKASPIANATHSLCTNAYYLTSLLSTYTPSNYKS